MSNLCFYSCLCPYYCQQLKYYGIMEKHWLNGASESHLVKLLLKQDQFTSGGLDSCLFEFKVSPRTVVTKIQIRLQSIPSVPLLTLQLALWSCVCPVGLSAAQLLPLLCIILYSHRLCKYTLGLERAKFVNKTQDTKRHWVFWPFPCSLSLSCSPPCWAADMLPHLSFAASVLMGAFLPCP